MKKTILFCLFAVIFSNGYAQKIINNPVNISSNVSGKITKIELSDKETVLHFNIKRNGGWFSVPNETYIQSSRKEGEKLFVTKAEGVTLNETITTTVNPEGIRYKLYFPPLAKGVDKINYGEANVGGNWFIYKIDLTKSRDDLLQEDILRFNSSLYNIKSREGFKIGQNGAVNFSSSLNPKVVVGYPLSNGETLLPEDLPKAFFGNWYDKYGTLMLIATPEFIVSNIRVSYYNNIQRNDGKYFINHSGGNIEIIKLDEDKMSLRNNKLQTFYKKPINNKVPKFLKGTWQSKKNKVIVGDTDVFFEGENSPYIFGSKQLKIVHVAPSKKGDLYWFILYNEGNHYIYIANKVDGEYMLSPRGWGRDGYKKIK